MCFQDPRLSKSQVMTLPGLVANAVPAAGKGVHMTEGLSSFTVRAGIPFYRCMRSPTQRSLPPAARPVHICPSACTTFTDIS